MDILRLRHGTTHYFDTNFLVLPPEILPNLSDLPESTRWITETTEQEVIEKLGEQAAREKLDAKYQTLRFNRRSIAEDEAVYASKSRQK